MLTFDHFDFQKFKQDTLLEIELTPFYQRKIIDLTISAGAKLLISLVSNYIRLLIIMYHE